MVVHQTVERLQDAGRGHFQRLRQGLARLGFAVSAEQQRYFLRQRHYAEQLPAWTLDIFLAHVLPEDREALSDALRRAADSETDLHCEFRIQHDFFASDQIDPAFNELRCYWHDQTCFSSFFH